MIICQNFILILYCQIKSWSWIQTASFESSMKEKKVRNLKGNRTKVDPDEKYTIPTWERQHVSLPHKHNLSTTMMMWSQSLRSIQAAAPVCVLISESHSEASVVMENRNHLKDMLWLPEMVYSTLLTKVILYKKLYYQFYLTDWENGKVAVLNCLPLQNEDKKNKKNKNEWSHGIQQTTTTNMRKYNRI